MNIPRVCPCCLRRSWTVIKRHRNTAYCEALDASNWLVSCEECYQEDYEHFQDLWDTYYSGLI